MSGLIDLISQDQDIKSYIKDNEGYNPNIYDDTKNIPTSGYGFNLKAEHIRRWIPKDVLSGKRGLKEDESNEIFEKVYRVAVDDAERYVGKDVFNNLSNDSRKALIDLSYNIGGTKLNKFVEMKKALINNNFEKAREELLNSKYAIEDVPNRALRNADLLFKKSNSISELSEFEKAFKKARKEGKKIFEFNGEKYTTEVK